MSSTGGNRYEWDLVCVVVVVLVAPPQLSEMPLSLVFKCNNVSVSVAPQLIANDRWCGYR